MKLVFIFVLENKVKTQTKQKIIVINNKNLIKMNKYILIITFLFLFYCVMYCLVI